MYNFGIVMTEDGKKLISDFETRLRHFIYLHDDLKKKYTEVKQLLEQEIIEKKKLEAEYTELAKNYENLKVASTLNHGGSHVKETRLRIDSLVREIDTCINMLNKEII